MIVEISVITENPRNQGMTKPTPSRSPLQAFASPDVGGVVQGAAALFWLPQAALLAMAVQGLASDKGFAAVLCCRP
jgi:ATP-binding cassette subfamily C protein CydD